MPSMLHAPLPPAALAAGYRLRPLARDDTPALFDLFGQPLCRQGMDMAPFGAPQALEDWLARTGAGNFQSVVVFGTTAVGFAGLFLDHEAAARTGWISLFVHDAHHGRGLGTLLMTALTATAHVLGVMTLKLDVFCDNAPAIALYRKFGFHVARRDDAYRHGDGRTLAAYTMVRRCRPGTAPHATAERRFGGLRVCVSPAQSI